MHSEQCNLSRRDVRHSLTHKGGEEGGEGGGEGGGEEAFLIEFPDNTEINLTPVKFDYSSAAAAAALPHCEIYAFLLLLYLPPLSLSFSLSAAPSKHY